MASSTTTFDVNAARQAGYSDDEILQHLTTTRPFDVQGAMKNGYSTGEIIDYLSQTPKSSSVAGIPTPAKGTFAMRPEDLGITSPIPVTVPKPHSVDKLGGLLRSGPTYLPSPETVHMPGSFEGHPENNAVSALEVPRQGAQDIRDYIDQQARSMDPEDTTTPRLAHAYKNIVAPAGEASADFLGAQYRPENLATLGAFKYLPSSTAALRTAKTLAGAYYGGQSAITAGKEAGAAFDAAQQGDVPGAVEHGVNAAFQAGAATDAARDLHAQRSQVASDAAPLVRQTNDLVQRHLPNAITSRLPESIQTPNTVARAAARQAATQADNLSAGLEQGSQPPKGVMTREDVTQPILDDIRAEAARQGVTPETLEGRNGYQAMKKVTEAVRSRYDDAYNTLIEPIRNEYAGDAARQAANEVVSKMLDDASLMDEIKRGTPDGTNVTQLQNIAGTIAKARTVGELDNARIALNRLASRFEGKSEGQQYESPLVQEALSAGADAIRNSLYQDMAQRYGGVTVNGESVGVPEEEIRDLQRAHGAAIQADRMMGDTARVLSSRANEEAAPPGPMARFRGLGYRATMGSKQHAAAGLIEKLFPPSEVDLFNTRMQRAIKGASPDDGRVFPTPPITPEYVDPREVPDMRTSPVAPRLPAAPPFAEVVPPNRPAALPPFIKGELPPASRIYGTPEETAQQVDITSGQPSSSVTPLGPTGKAGVLVRRLGLLPGTVEAAPSTASPVETSQQSAALSQVRGSVPSSPDQQNARTPATPSSEHGTANTSVAPDSKLQTDAPSVDIHPPKSFERRGASKPLVSTPQETTPVASSEEPQNETQPRNNTSNTSSTSPIPAIRAARPKKPTPAARPAAESQPAAIPGTQPQEPAASAESVAPVPDQQQNAAPKKSKVPAIAAATKPQAGPTVQPSKYSPDVEAGLKAWAEGRAYIDGNGNYHEYLPAPERPSGKKRGPISTWNKAVKTAFSSVDDLHKAAQQYKQPTAPAPKQAPELTKSEGVENQPVPAGAQQLTPASDVADGRKFEGRYLRAALEPAKGAWDEHDGKGKPNGLKADRLVVQVPGDGRFTIPNTPKAIDHALKASDSFTQPTAPRYARTVPKAPAEFDNDAYVASLQKEIRNLEAGKDEYGKAIEDFSRRQELLRVAHENLRAATTADVSERRQNLEMRKRVSQMTPEEMRQALLTSESTGLPNRRAFDEAEERSPAPAVAISDADGLKALNDAMGYGAGNELLKAKAHALKEAGLEAFHDKGDEYLYRANSKDELVSKLEKAREILRSTPFEVTDSEGNRYIITGADFSYGTGSELTEAEAGLHQHKSEREAAGLRKRGELGSISATPQGRQEVRQPQSATPADAGKRPDAVEGSRKGIPPFLRKPKK